MSSTPRLPTAAHLPWWRTSLLVVFLAGAGIGVLAGMIGLGGGVSSAASDRCVRVRGSARDHYEQGDEPDRRAHSDPGAVAQRSRPEPTPHLYIVVNLLAGSLVGAWLGAHWVTRLSSKMLYRVIAALLVLIAVLLFVTHFFAIAPQPLLW